MNQYHVALSELLLNVLMMTSIRLLLVQSWSFMAGAHDPKSLHLCPVHGVRCPFKAAISLHHVILGCSSSGVGSPDAR